MAWPFRFNAIPSGLTAIRRSSPLLPFSCGDEKGKEASWLPRIRWSPANGIRHAGALDGYGHRDSDRERFELLPSKGCVRPLIFATDD